MIFGQSTIQIFSHSNINEKIMLSFDLNQKDLNIT